MPSTTPSKPPDLVALSNDGRDDILPQHDDLQDGDIPISVSETLSPLKSFIPIIEKLPGLVLDNNQYFVDGPLLMTELPELVSYAQRISEIILTDTHSAEPDVAPETLARLALVQDLRNPFLSSLNCLRLINADQSLSYLFFCITPSLQTLEIVGIPLNRQITISSFFKELVPRAPQLTNLILRDRLPESVLKCIPNFINLHQLHLLDAVKSFDFSFLQGISTLSNLEDLIIEACTTEYTGRALTSASCLIDSDSQPDSKHIIPIDGQVTPPGAIHSSFRQLQKLTIIGNVSLIGDLVRCLRPRSAKGISLTLVRQSRSASSLSHPVADEHMPTSCQTNNTNGDAADFADPMYIMSVKEVNLSQDPFDHYAPESKTLVVKDGNGLQLSFEEQRHRSYISSGRIAPPKNNALISVEPQTPAFGDAIEQILDFGSPESISLDYLFEPSQPTFGNIPVSEYWPIFPLTTLKRIFSSPTLKELDFGHWRIPEIPLVDQVSCDSSASSTDAASASPPMSLKSLRLPKDINSGQLMSSLHQFVHHFPCLTRLECYFAIPPPAGLELELGTHVVPHPLKILSVDGFIPSPEDKINIATYLSLLFPDLKAIETQSKDWEYVFSLVKMCQTVSLAVERRLQFTASR